MTDFQNNLGSRMYARRLMVDGTIWGAVKRDLKKKLQEFMNTYFQSIKNLIKDISL